MEIDLMSIISGIIKDNESKNILPHGADVVQVMNKVKDQVNIELNKLYREKKISVYKTLNSKSIDINE